jgi:hypothetical protein
MLVVLAGLLMAGGAVQAQPVPVQNPAAAQYDVIALRVEFQPDTTRFTTGDGTFEGALFDDGLTPAVDPLPHDAAYFEAHLSFLEHYVDRVSDGQTQVQTHLVPEVVRVSQKMAAYSPTGPDADSPEERAKLYALIREAWTRADEDVAFDGASFDPETTVFVLLHAGVGRDVELIGTTLDKTPQDLPSLSLAGRTFAEAVGTDLTLNGLPVTNTLIIPRTETRQGTNFVVDEPFLLELSINGLLAASFFNALGVPDLFNTETGETAIGTFGLMDPNGIFAFRGLFPPEPSAWTKQFLGWTTPQEVDGAEAQTVSLRAASLSDGSDVARVPISDVEYFLVETRHRDPEGDGLVLQVWQDGAIVEQRVQNGDDDFDGVTSIDGFVGGVVVAVDNYDWALPGGLLRDGTGDPVLDEEGNPIPLNGGMLIWHIDERRLADGTVNDDPGRRAVDLEEADSAQDLGFDAPASVAAGSPFDFWFEGNSVTALTSSGAEVQLYENRFGPDTQPPSTTNAGGPSFITLEDFSPTGVEMAFTYRRTDRTGITPTLDVFLADTTTEYKKGGGLLFEGDDWLVAYGGSDEGVFRVINGSAQGVGTSLAMPASTPAFSTPTLTVQGDQYVVKFDMSQGQEDLVGRGFFLPTSLSNLFPASPILADGSDDSPLIILFAGPETATLVRARSEEDTEVESISGIGEGIGVSLLPEGAAVVAGREGAVHTATDQRWSYSLGPSAANGQPAFGLDRSGLIGIVPDLGENELWWLLADGTTQPVDVSRYVDADAAMNAFPVLADLDADGRLDVVTTVGTSVLAFSQGGALLPGFPIRLDAPSVTQPLVAELSDSGGWSLVLAATDGNVYAYDLGRGGALVDGFPLAVGASIEATPLLQDQTLYAISTNGALKAWRLDAMGEVWWGQLYANAQNQNYVALDEDAPPAAPASSELLVADETYNWPNPIQEGQTFLRCMTTQDARVDIRIIDAAGQLVDEMEMTLRGGVPAEHQWQTSAPSGLYYARIRATADDGTTDTQLVKMAVIR